VALHQPVALEFTGPPTPTPTPQSALFIPKKNKPPTYDGKSSPDSWIAHLSSYVYGQSDDHALSIAITYLSGDAHDWFIANQMAANAAGYPMVAWTALIEALSKRFNPLNKTKLARDKLSRWRQIKDVQTYNTNFLKS
jgi:Retrotransposon gag protein